MVLDCPQTIPFPGVDDWLSSAFEINGGDKPAVAFKPKSFDETVVVGLVWRIMNLSTVLLRAVRVPVFSVGQILSLRRKSPGSWHFLLAQPRVDYTPGDPYKHAYQIATKAVKWLINRPQTSTNREYLFRILKQEFVDKFNVTPMGGESTIAVLREAWKMGIEFRHLGSGTYQLGVGKSQLKLDRGAIQYDSAIGAKISNDKFRSANLLRDAGLPAAVHLQAGSQQAALAAANRLGWPVVIKPADRDRGEGVTVNVSSDQQVLAAFQRAVALSQSILVERQALGVCHRVLVAQGRVCIVAKRMPKSVKGDGLKSVRELVHEANTEENLRPPWSRLKPFLLDDMALDCLASVGMNPDSVPAEGIMAPLRPIQTSEWGGVVEDFTDRIHPENAAMAIKAARLFGLSTAGIDIISTDITRPWHETGAIINEVNFSPLLAGRTTDGVIASLIGGWVPDHGHIPIEAVISSGSGLALGLRIQSDYVSQGVSCYLASNEIVVSPTGEISHLDKSGLFGRCYALLMDHDVEAIVMVVQTDELLKTGLPVSRIDRIHEEPDDQLKQSEIAQSQEQPTWVYAMRRLLQMHLMPLKSESVQRTEVM